MKKIFFLLLSAAAVFFACQTDEPETPPVYDPTPFLIAHGDFPPPPLPDDNKPTVAGVELGRMLFYEKKLSKDGTQSCADCHIQADGFSDLRQFSLGVEGLPGERQAMSVFNMAWHRNGLFWDGRSPSLRDQALRPIQDPLEMNETLENAVQKLKDIKDYRHQFVRAFGDEQITPERMGLAMEQFMFSIVSFNSKYDQFLRGEAALTESEMRGRDLFFKEPNPVAGEKGAECFHCHGGFNFTNDQFMNNGLDTDANFTDLGRYLVTNLDADKAKFKTPTLRNIALTPPYMHDGRFATLEEVIEHYNTGVKQSSTVDFLLHFNLNPGLQLEQQDIEDLIAFLHTLTDMDFVNNEAFSSPF